MTYNFTQAFTTVHYDIKIDPAQRYGYFEHHTLGDLQGGGLWFDSLDDGRLKLYDIDGTTELPSEVSHALRRMGCLVSDEFI